MRVLLFLIVCGSLAPAWAVAQAPAPSPPEPTARLVGLPVTAAWARSPALRPPVAGPTARAVPDVDSLPDGMPLRTRLLWGRRGLMRTLGLAPSTRRGELRLRRAMLQWHQRMGLLTFGALTTQVVLGELMARNPARYYNDLRPIHRPLGYATFGAYMTTASLSLFAPPGRVYRSGFSSVRLHRWLAVVHFAGMALQPWLGVRLSEATGATYDRRLAQHRWAGRITLAAYTTAILSIFLPY